MISVVQKRAKYIVCLGMPAVNNNKIDIISTFQPLFKSAPKVCPRMRTVIISTFQPLFKSAPKVCPGMPAVNNNNNNDSSAQHAHCQCVYCSWECFGGVYCSLGMFGNVWECFGGIYCSLGMFGNVLEESIVLWEYLLFGVGAPLDHYYGEFEWTEFLNFV